MTLTVVIPPACAFWSAESAHVDRVEHPDVGLDRRGGVGARTPPMWEWVSTRPGIRTLPDTSRRRASGGIAHAPLGAHGHDPAPVHDDDAFRDLRPGDRDHAGAGERDRRLLRGDGGASRPRATPATTHARILDIGRQTSLMRWEGR